MAFPRFPAHEAPESRFCDLARCRCRNGQGVARAHVSSAASARVAGVLDDHAGNPEAVSVAVEIAPHLHTWLTRSHKAPMNIGKATHPQLSRSNSQNMNAQAAMGRTPDIARPKPM